MHQFEVFMIAVGLAMDAFAVCVAAAASGRAKGGRAAFRLSFHFGLFQFLMPVLGWFVGVETETYIAAGDHWVAFALLSWVGIRMILSGTGNSTEFQARDPSRGMTLVMLSVATSIDAFAVGFSLALLQISIWFPSVVIGVVTAFLSLLGVQLGGRLGTKFGKKTEVFGGLTLILIGLRILISHLWQ